MEDSARNNNNTGVPNLASAPPPATPSVNTEPPPGKIPVDPLEPGQFVITGEDTIAPTAPELPPQSIPPIPPGPSIVQMPPQPISGYPPEPAVGGQESGFGSQAEVFTGAPAESGPYGNLVQTTPEAGQFEPTQGGLSQGFDVGGEQPNPTPFVAPTIPTAAPAAPSKLKKLRVLAIGGGVFLVLAIASVGAWFFVLNKTTNSQTSKALTEESKVEEPPPLPKKATLGFATLPLPSRESTAQASASASPR